MNVMMESVCLEVPVNVMDSQTVMMAVTRTAVVGVANLLYIYNKTL